MCEGVGSLDRRNDVSRRPFNGKKMARPTQASNLRGRSSISTARRDTDLLLFILYNDFIHFHVLVLRHLRIDSPSPNVRQPLTTRGEHCQPWELTIVLVEAVRHSCQQSLHRSIYSQMPTLTCSRFR